MTLEGSQWPPSARHSAPEKWLVSLARAIVAREYGIPAVLGILGVLSLLHDGQMIQIERDVFEKNPQVVKDNFINNNY